MDVAPVLDTTRELPVSDPVRLRDEPPTLDEPAAEPVGSEVIQAALTADQPHDLLEGPHAALHAKLRSLRRGETPQDSVSSK